MNDSSSKLPQTDPPLITIQYSHTALRSMAGMYCMGDLLNLVLREHAEELHLQVDRPPVMVVEGDELAIDVTALTTDNVTELFQSFATENQLKELRACGEIHFIYLFQHSARFSVSARVQHQAFDVKIKNLSR